MNLVNVIEHKILNMNKIKHYDKILEYLCLDCDDFNIEKMKLKQIMLVIIKKLHL